MAISKLRPALPQGDSLGGRKIVRVLGEGGFGITYRVRHQYLESYFAIKELFPRGCIRDEQKQVIPAPEAPEYTEGSLSNDEFTASRRNFLHEGRSLAQLKFPGIVEVVDLLEANNTAYLVMELVSGRHLGEVVTPAAEPHFAGESPQASANALSIFDAFEIIEAISHPLEHIHQKKTIHRDIKPSNIMWDSQKKLATLIDFGGARDFLRNHHLMRDGLYSYGYTALEQYELRAKRDPKEDDPNQLDAATDIYGLAATLFYLLTGHTPTDARVRKSSDTLRYQFHKLRQDISAPFVDALFAGLALHKRDRPRSVPLFLSELERGLGSRSRPTTMDVIQRVREENQAQERREMAVKAAVVLALILVILAGFAAMVHFMQGNVFQLGDKQFSREGMQEIRQPRQIEPVSDPPQAAH